MSLQLSAANLTCRHCHAPTSESIFLAGTGPYCCHACAQLAALLTSYATDGAANFANQLTKQNLPQAKLAKYAHLNQADFRLHYSSPEKRNEFRIFIKGITCASCIQILESLPRILKGVKSCELNFGKSILTLQLEPTCGLGEVTRTIEGMGYSPFVMLPEQTSESLQLQENRQDLMRIGVAFAATANIMILAVSIYSGLEGELETWFNLLQGLIFLPILAFCALPFYQAALRTLKFAKISIDLPIVIALSLSSILSYRNLFLGQGPIYFDSTAGFILLILLSRTTLKRIQQKNSQLTQALHLFDQHGAWVQESQQLTFKPVEHIRKDDLVVVHNGERVPVDGVLESTDALLDFSLLTGEALPKRLQQGMQVFAGTKSYSQLLQLRASKTAQESLLAQMMQKVTHTHEQKTPFVLKTDQYAQYLIFSVLMIAAAFLVFYAPKDFTDAISRALALIVLACPCALALGAPLALSQGIRRALQEGIIIKKPEALEKAMQIKSIAFDKTGTLTYGELSLKDCPLLAQELKSLILSLESQSSHPIAQAFRNCWRDLPLLPIEQLREIPGLGVCGLLDGDFYELKKPLQQPAEDLPVSAEMAAELALGPAAVLYRNGRKLLSFSFQDFPRIEAKPLLENLQKLKIHSYLLSGDQQKSVEKVAQTLGLREDQYFFNQSPEQKRVWIQQHPFTAMVGDGLNDIQSMLASGVSISVRKSALEALEVSDVYIAESNISKIFAFFRIAQQTKKVIFLNIAFALVYNIAAGSAALLGWIGPMGAAILMPVSSFIIIAHSFFGMQKGKA